MEKKKITRKERSRIKLLRDLVILFLLSIGVVGILKAFSFVEHLKEESYFISALLDCSIFLIVYMVLALLILFINNKNKKRYK